MAEPAQFGGFDQILADLRGTPGDVLAERHPQEVVEATGQDEEVEDRPQQPGQSAVFGVVFGCFAGVLDGGAVLFGLGMRPGFLRRCRGATEREQGRGEDRRRGELAPKFTSRARGER
ncbi:MAG: hypothetical protein R2708_03320 [Vicinamibacterales bacterium]